MIHQPVLQYYNVRQEVTIQCDASEVGLRATLLQNGQPIAYASRALSKTEECYAQIENECLAIVFVCERFALQYSQTTSLLKQFLGNPFYPLQNDSSECYYASKNTLWMLFIQEGKICSSQIPCHVLL